MAYDEELADRVRELVPVALDLQEKQMFGGLSFLVGGKMAIAVSGEGGLLVRVDPQMCDHLVDTTTAEVAVMKGRPMTGWLRVPLAGVATDAELDRWVQLGTSYARTLTPT
ncbi:MAG: TfoX/Sxy family protein [Acidimicrobiales bacterium]